MNNATEPAFPMIGDPNATHFKNGLTKEEYLAMQIFPDLLKRYGPVDKHGATEAAKESILAAKTFFEVQSGK